MIYSSLEFLVAFPIYCLIHWSIPARLRLAALALASLAFYMYGEPSGAPILIGVLLVAYASGLAMERWPERTRLIVVTAVAVLLFDLGFFKYAGFLSSLVPLVITVPVVFLPLGISFYTFEAISYVVDLKRGTERPERSFVRLGLFVGVFPHLISGPIMRANEILPQLRSELEWHLPTFLSGLQLFVEGLVKKRVIADTAGIVADRVFGAPSEVGTSAAWIGALAYTMQIYGDFAGYTDMGRGIARMLGFELPFNFDDPYAASSITNFWRRWHISLSRWLRDYLYIPLGGNRAGELRTYANVILTMLLGGLWHGAGWTFVAWGGYHGVLLAIERRLRLPGRLPGILTTPITLLLVINGWVLFRAHDFGTYLTIAAAMYIPRKDTPGLIDQTSAIGVIVMSILVVSAMVLHRYAPGLVERVRIASLRTGALYGAAFGLAIVLVLLAATPRPFIYFRF